MEALADCRESAFSEDVDNPYLVGAVGDPMEVPAYVAYQIEWLSGMLDHWQSNHDNQVSRARFLIERGDIPVERVRAYEEVEQLRERVKDAEGDAVRLHADKMELMMKYKFSGMEEDAGRYRWFCGWFARGGARSEIDPHGHMRFTTREIINENIDAARGAK
jgi:hypothetical protein